MLVLYIFVFYINDIILYVFTYNFFLLLAQNHVCEIHHINAVLDHSFSLLCEWIFFILLCTLSCSQFFVFRNNDATNIPVHISLYTLTRVSPENGVELLSPEFAYPELRNVVATCLPSVKPLCTASTLYELLLLHIFSCTWYCQMF